VLGGGAGEEHGAAFPAFTPPRERSREDDGSADAEGPPRACQGFPSITVYSFCKYRISHSILKCA
jgi:hypothetical protein